MSGLLLLEHFLLDSVGCKLLQSVYSLLFNCNYFVFFGVHTRITAVFLEYHQIPENVVEWLLCKFYDRGFTFVRKMIR